MLDLLLCRRSHYCYILRQSKNAICNTCYSCYSVECHVMERYELVADTYLVKIKMLFVINVIVVRVLNDILNA